MSTGGLEVLGRIRSEERKKLLPVIVYSTSKEDPDVRSAYELGGNSFIAKPFDFEGFSEAMRSLNCSDSTGTSHRHPHRLSGLEEAIRPCSPKECVEGKFSEVRVCRVLGSTHSPNPKQGGILRYSQGDFVRR